ncbi:MAG: C39 family peptidase, partial [Oscillospiraceae bacterium]
PNNGGTDAELVKGIRYASSDTVTYQYSSSPLSFASHQTNIDGSNPLVVWMKWSPTSAHVVVCAGYKTTTTNNYLYLVDPIEDTTKAYYDYAHLKNGTSIQSGTGTYDHTIYKK